MAPQIAATAAVLAAFAPETSHNTFRLLRERQVHSGSRACRRQQASSTGASAERRRDGAAELLPAFCGRAASPARRAHWAGYRTHYPQPADPAVR